MNLQDRLSIQEKQYAFPYHHVPHMTDGVWRVSTALWWGYEYLAVLSMLTELVLSCKPQKVLDFGCGDGRFVHELARLGVPTVVGVDISERSLLFAQAFAHGTSCRFYRSIREVPESDFCVVIAMEALEHVSDGTLPNVLADIQTMLSDDGRFIVSVPTINVPLNPKHHRHYTVELLEEQIAGIFSVVDIRFIHRTGLLAKLIRRMHHNFLFTATYEPWLRLSTYLYQKFVMRADLFEGAHLIAVLKKYDKVR